MKTPSFHQDARDCSPEAAEWPSGLAELPRPPTTLRLHGAIPEGPRVAVVGTRRADPGALSYTRRICAELAEAGVVIVSGGASGIDAAAHWGALEGGMGTVAVLAGGLAQPYPRGNLELFEAIAERGALLSEMSDQTPPTPPRFLLRNRIVAAISRLVWVVQAPARSGALSTARIGDRLGRPIFATPASPWDPRGAGNVELLAEGALAMGGVEAILGHLQLEPGTKPEERREPRDSTPPELREIVEALGKEPTHPDVLARRLDRSAASIQRDLLELLLLGRVMERAGGYIALPR